MVSNHLSTTHHQQDYNCSVATGTSRLERRTIAPHSVKQTHPQPHSHKEPGRSSTECQNQMARAGGLEARTGWTGTGTGKACVRGAKWTKWNGKGGGSGGRPRRWTDRNGKGDRPGGRLRRRADRGRTRDRGELRGRGDWGRSRGPRGTRGPSGQRPS